jgi:type I restriction enzyme S subunit
VESPLGQIPEGWEVKPFSAIASYVNGYPFKPAELGPAGKPIIKIKELKAGIVADTPRNTGDEIPGKYHIHNGDVLFSWSADLDAYLWMGGDGLLNQHLFTVLPADAFSLAFCFHSLKESMPRFRALSLGATMHHIKRSALDQVFTVVAPAPMRNRFDVLVEPIHEQLITISKLIQNLRQSRDLLLPRLLSGLVDIEALPNPDLSEP